MASQLCLIAATKSLTQSKCHSGVILGDTAVDAFDGDESATIVHVDRVDTRVRRKKDARNGHLSNYLLRMEITFVG